MPEVKLKDIEYKLNILEKKIDYIFQNFKAQNELMKLLKDKIERLENKR